MVFEDTCILCPEQDYSTVCETIGEGRAGVFAYGNKKARNWHGTKGLYMTPEWCEDMSTILKNKALRNFKHADLWLRDLVRRDKSRGFELWPALGGYGHRISMTISSSEGLKWGGAWLPQHRWHAATHQ